MHTNKNTNRWLHQYFSRETDLRGASKLDWIRCLTAESPAEEGLGLPHASGETKNTFCVYRLNLNFFVNSTYKCHSTVRFMGSGAVASWRLFPASQRSASEILHTSAPGTTLSDSGLVEHGAPLSGDCFGGWERWPRFFEQLSGRR